MIETKMLDKLLDVLLKKTMSSDIEWLSLPEYFEENKNELLRRYIIDTNKYAYSEEGYFKKNQLPVISEYQSRCALINGGVIALLSFDYSGGQKTTGCTIQVSPDSPVNVLDCTVEQNEKIRKMLAFAYNNQYTVIKYVKEILES